MAKKTTVIPQAAYADTFVYNGESMDPKQFVEKLEDAFAEQEHWKGAYFWGGDNGNRQRRSWQDRKDSHTDVFEYNGHEYRYEVDVTRSRKNTYVNSNTFTMDGGGDIRAWKKVRDQVVNAHPDLFPDRVQTKNAEEKPAAPKNVNAGLDVYNVDRSYMVGNVTLADGTPGILMFDVFGGNDYTNTLRTVSGKYSLVSAIPADSEEVADGSCELYRCFCKEPTNHSFVGDYPLSGKLNEETYMFRHEWVSGRIEDQIAQIDYLDDFNAGIDALSVANELIANPLSFDAEGVEPVMPHSDRVLSSALSGMLDKLDAGFICVSDQSRSLSGDEYWRIENAKATAIEKDLDARHEHDAEMER